MTATTFTDVEFMSAREKAKVSKEWKTFLASDMDRSKFTKSLYNHLHLHCNHIAHYDIDGFYDAQLSEYRDMFIRQFIDDFQSGRLFWGRGIEYKDIHTEMYNDLLSYIR